MPTTAVGGVVSPGVWKLSLASSKLRISVAGVWAPESRSCSSHSCVLTACFPHSGLLAGCCSRSGGSALSGRGVSARSVLLPAVPGRAMSCIYSSTGIATPPPPLPPTPPPVGSHGADRTPSPKPPPSESSPLPPPSPLSPTPPTTLLVALFGGCWCCCCCCSWLSEKSDSLGAASITCVVGEIRSSSAGGPSWWLRLGKDVDIDGWVDSGG